MKQLPVSIAAALAAIALAGAVSQSQAQSTTPAPAPKAPPQGAKSKGKQPPKAPAEAALPTASQVQLEAAERALYGDYACEFDQTVNISRNAKHVGYVDVAWKKDRFTMVPVVSSTGAIRLEDVKGRAVMIQIAMKSMLLDAKAGQRLVDECVHADQLAARQAAASAPPQGSIGIDPAIAAQPQAPAAPGASATNTR